MEVSAEALYSYLDVSNVEEVATTSEPGPSEQPLMTSTPMKGRDGFMCEDCGSTYKHQRSLDAHRREKHSHSGGPRYQCELCPKALMQPSEFQSHMNMHGRIKPFQCDVCKKRYANIRSLRRHVCKNADATHKCRTCSKTFKSKKYLQDHEFSHADKPRYSCEKCNKQFKYRSGLHRHRQKQGDCQPVNE